MPQLDPRKYLPLKDSLEQDIILAQQDVMAAHKVQVAAQLAYEQAVELKNNLQFVLKTLRALDPKAAASDPSLDMA